MMLSNLIQAIDVALEFLGVTKLCSAWEDEAAYYFAGCGDSGEPLFADASCRIDKETLEAKRNLPRDPWWDTKKTEIPFPEERMSCYIPLEKVLGLE